jgi:small multidrug resistance family-3 protein
MDTTRSISLFLLAALAEIGGAWLIWQGLREHKGVLWIAAGVLALGAYGFVAAFQPDPNFGRILAAYGGIFVAGSLAWGMVVDGFRPDRWDVIGAAICLVGVAVIMYAPRTESHWGGGPTARSQVEAYRFTCRAGTVARWPAPPRLRPLISPLPLARCRSPSLPGLPLVSSAA